MTTSQTFAQAIHHHRTGDLAKAEALYRQILVTEPNHSEALHHLGIIAHQVGRHSLAVEFISKSLALAPRNVDAYCNLGECFRSLGRPTEAIAAFHQALQLQPDSPAGHNNLGNALRENEKAAQAETAFRRALALKPDFVEAHNNLGNALKDQDRMDEATAAYRAAIKLAPQLAETYSNLGAALTAQEKLEEAESAYRQAIALQPTFAIAYNGLGATLAARRQFPEAMAAIRHALQLKPHLPEAYNNLGTAFTDQEQMADAIAAYRQALALNPSYPEACFNLGNALRHIGQLDQAVAAYRDALRLQPNYPSACNNLGNALKDQAQLDEALASYRLALQWKPEFREARSNLIYTLHFHPLVAQHLIGEEQLRWNQQMESLLSGLDRSDFRARQPRPRLRVGYVSPEFRDHVTGRYLAPFFREHDREHFEIVCYSGVKRTDASTEFYRQHSDLWRETFGLADEALFDLIRTDDVDILVDLTQHLSGNRLPVFARRPAPVQISFAGYPETTGVEAIRYRISDRYLAAETEDTGSKMESDPRSPNSELRSAEQVFLLDSFWCYDPCGLEVKVSKLPCLDDGVVTFGCLNNFCKVNEPFLRLCAQVLAAVKNSRIVFLTAFGGHREWVRQILHKEGIEEHRVEFMETQTRRAYLEQYHRLDIVLDPFPYNGHTTSMDALWMGVPVVSLVGTSSVSRAGLSILTNLGLPEWAAFSSEDYIATATRLAGDRHSLAHIRGTLRSRMEASPLMDAPRFARGIENVYRTVWRRWCAGNQSA